MNAKLKLHEAIAVVLLNCEGRKATTNFIAQEINQRKLYIRKDNQANYEKKCHIKL